MKRLILVVAFLLALSVPAFAQEFSDVDPSHWAYDAVEQMAREGLLSGYPDGTFKGTRQLTRYEVAAVLARIYNRLLKEIEAAKTGKPTTIDSAKLDEYMAKVEKLAAEFRDELARIDSKLADLDNANRAQDRKIDDIQALLDKVPAFSGTLRFRGTGYVDQGALDQSNRLGYEVAWGLGTDFHPADEVEIVTNWQYWQDGGGNPNSPYLTAYPGWLRVEQLYATIDLKRWAPFGVAEGVTFKVGDQYYSHGEFGLSGDNSYLPTLGARLDLTAPMWDAYLATYRLGFTNSGTLFGTTNPNSNYSQNSQYVKTADDILNLGAKIKWGEGTQPGHANQVEVGVDWTPEGAGAEEFVGFSGNAEIPFMPNVLNGIRGEWVFVLNNQADFDPEDLNLTNGSWIAELDLYNDGNSKLSLAGGMVGQIEALPRFANVDNDPFNEFDITRNANGDVVNNSFENGKNYFPSDFQGFGITAEHTFKNKLWGKATWYTGTRIDAVADERPDAWKLSFKYPFAQNSTVGLDLISAGSQDGLDDPVSLVRGELLFTF